MKSLHELHHNMKFPQPLSQKIHVKIEIPFRIEYASMMPENRIVNMLIVFESTRRQSK